VRVGASGGEKVILGGGVSNVAPPHLGEGQVGNGVSFWVFHIGVWREEKKKRHSFVRSFVHLSADSRYIFGIIIVGLVVTAVAVPKRLKLVRQTPALFLAF
jgi:hypothetical protein